MVRSRENQLSSSGNDVDSPENQLGRSDDESGFTHALNSAHQIINCAPHAINSARHAINSARLVSGCARQISRCGDRDNRRGPRRNQYGASEKHERRVDSPCALGQGSTGLRRAFNSAHFIEISPRACHQKRHSRNQHASSHVTSVLSKNSTIALGSSSACESRSR
jgi:hypothetical protein